MITRRNFLGFIAVAPAIVKASSLMMISPLPRQQEVVLTYSGMDPYGLQVLEESTLRLLTSVDWMKPGYLVHMSGREYVVTKVGNNDGDGEWHELFMQPSPFTES